VLQGVGGALISSNSGAIIADTFGQKERGKAFGYTGLGWSIGEPAVRIVKIYADYSLYVTIGVLAVMLITWWWRRSRTSRRTA